MFINNLPSLLLLLLQRHLVQGGLSRTASSWSPVAKAVELHEVQVGEMRAATPRWVAFSSRYLIPASVERLAGAVHGIVGREALGRAIMTAQREVMEEW